MMNNDGTSASNPLRIATLDTGLGGGAIGITFAPGKRQPAHSPARTARPRRPISTHRRLERRRGGDPGRAARARRARDRDLGAEVRRRHMEWHHWPIRTIGVRTRPSTRHGPRARRTLRALLACGGRVLIHCKGGLGRAGTIAARLLVETGCAPPRRSRGPGRAARRHRDGGAGALGERGPGAPLPAPRRIARPAARDRAAGALLGLAVGDALGATIEFEPKPRFAVLDDMVGGRAAPAGARAVDRRHRHGAGARRQPARAHPGWTPPT